MVMPSASSGSEKMEHPGNLSPSLAGPYLVQCSFEDNQGTWSLVHLSGAAIPTNTDSDGNTYKSQGARAWATLHSPLKQSAPSLVLQCQCKSTDNGCTGTIRVTCTGNDAEAEADSSYGDLVPVLSRLLAQWTISRQYQGRHPDTKEWMLEFPNNAKNTDSDTMMMTMNDWTSNGGIRKLFASFLDPTTADVELVEMVDRDGNALGILPRKLVHTHNLLHRGIGMFVTKDRHINSSSSSSDNPSHFPDLYVHRRTDTKRIFPSLYDMFVGGVATAGEDLRTTACREVAEELGLLEQSHLSTEDPILSCVVCTAYNRCFVTLYCYRMDTGREQVSWQEEEVAWGEFVSYAIVQAAADRSIKRFQAKGEWPGSEPPMQSASQGAAPADVSYDSNDWTDWDFVPDGLLVWEAWLQWLAR